MPSGLKFRYPVFSQMIKSNLVGISKMGDAGALGNEIVWSSSLCLCDLSFDLLTDCEFMSCCVCVCVCVCVVTAYAHVSLIKQLAPSSEPQPHAHARPPGAHG